MPTGGKKGVGEADTSVDYCTRSDCAAVSGQLGVSLGPLRTVTVPDVIAELGKISR